MVHSIGKTIAELRKANGWTQAKLAERLNVSDKAISKWESGGGYPEITQFPVLAKIFNVTIDYIMTGAEPIIMSRLEYCAKTDNVNLASKFELTTTDELGNTLIDYVIQHESTKVFSSLADRESFKFDYERYDINILYKLALISNRTDILDRYTFYKHQYISDQKAYPKLIKPMWYCITDELLDVIALDERINSDTIAYLLSNHDRKLTHLLHRCYLHGKMDLVDLILSTFEKNNQYAYDNVDIGGPDRIIETDNGYCRLITINKPSFSGVHLENFGEAHCICVVLKKTIDLSTSNGDTHYSERFNKINNDIKNYWEKFYKYLEVCELF